MGSKKKRKTSLERLDYVLDIAASRPVVREAAADARRLLERLMEDETNLELIEQALELGTILAKLEWQFKVGPGDES